MKSNKRLNWNDFGASQYNSNKVLKEMINKIPLKATRHMGAGAFYTLN
jgi:hypothetical protein